jgi:hypothetical protein
MAGSKVVLRVLLIAGLAAALSLFSPSSDTQGYAVPSADGRLALQERILSGAAQGGRVPSASLAHQDQDPPATGWLQEDATHWTYLPLASYSRSRGEWVTFLYEDFEGDFPGKEWIVEDRNEGYGEYYWAKRHCPQASAGHIGWPVGGGADGGELECGDNYPDHVYSWMKYGPFSLADATSAELRFRRWLNTPGEEDSLQYMVSIDGSSYNGLKIWGRSEEWKETVFDLTKVPVFDDVTGELKFEDVTGEPRVWILLVFESDGADNLPEGAYLDDIVLRKWIPAENASQAP